ncbi:MAG: exodeoxyribonuclease VII small subunit [Lentisphaeria bacterium]|nr:exodeoxyribonuclease VII small subunit [Lentisphaeria bacterium]NQZ67025.1 exodeoxyribonuclease VII small subunit [Lentisphaeria bacterium]
MTDKAIEIPEDTKFEDALNELEEIVEKMESGDLSLDDSLAFYERGTALNRFCQKRLNESSKKIELLKKTSDTTAEWQDKADQ